ncbi:hypothetical protein ACNKHX_16885 [Shigella flexneri]
MPFRRRARQDRLVLQRAGARRHLHEDVDSIYKIPALFKSQELDSYFTERFGLNCTEADLAEWEQVIFEEANPTEVTIGMVGKYIAAGCLQVRQRGAQARWPQDPCPSTSNIDSQDIETRGAELLEGLDAILVPGGFG